MKPFYLFTADRPFFGILPSFLLILALLPSPGKAQDTLWVEYHDFHWQHPDFGGPGGTDPVQQKCNGGNNTQIVQALLPADKTPLPTGNPVPIPNTAAERAECLDLNIPSWFAPKAGDPGYHKSFRGFLVDQGLPNDGKFEYDVSGFYPIDTVTGAQVYANGHNNLFCLEVHTDFPYMGGEVFNFRGDDDVWLYINNRLALDIGGLHTPVTNNLDLDARAAELGMVRGQTYDFDFYYCERQYSGSNIRIMTNIPIAAPPKVATPIATPGSSTFTSQVNVSLMTPTPGATIYYTVNGATPDSNSVRYVDGTPIAVIGTTVIKAIAYKEGWEKSDVMTATYTKTFTASTLDILDANGNPLQGGYLTELNTAYTVRINTTQAGLTALSPTAVTKTATDNETLSLTSPTSSGDRLVYSLKVDFSIAAKAANGKTEASTYDSLTVRWVNPSDPNDVAEKKVLVRPAPKQAFAYFSTKPDGSDTTDRYAGTETVIYLVVVDQVLPAGVQPKATLVTRPLVSGTTPENESFNLTPIAGRPGYLVATIPVDLAGAVSTNGRLRLATGDQITGTYLDPVDTESPAVANAGFGAAAAIDGNLQFTDASYNPLPGGIHFSPAEGRLYLRLVDDWADGTILSKQVTLTIQNNRGAAPPDAETFNITLVAGKRQGSSGVWEGSLPLKDLLAIMPNNGTAETYILGEVTAKVTSHNGTGAIGDEVSDNLLVAYPDVASKLTLEDSRGPAVSIGRVTDGILVKLTDQSLSSGTDTLTVALRCSQTGDILQVKVIETSPGNYVSQVIPKGEGPSLADGRLQCLEKDIINAKVTDPVYLTGDDINVQWNNTVEPRLYYVRVGGDSAAITTVREGDEAAFKAVVEATGKSLTVADTVVVTFTTPQGERETFLAVETATHSQRFEVVVPIAFVTGSPLAGNKTVEGRITSKEVDNRVTATGSVTVGGLETRRDIVLVAAYVPVVKAWIKDENGDGRADKVYIQFQKTVGREPATLEAQWNSDASAFKSLTDAKLSFNADSTILIADYTGSPFDPGLTAIAPGTIPKARLPADPLFAGQTPAIEDSIGPVIIDARKHPADVNSLKPNDPSFNLDTLKIKVSEPLVSGSNLLDMIKFSTSCGDYANAKAVIAIGTPVFDPVTNTYTLIVDNSGSNVPLVGNCVFLNSDPGKLTDAAGNKPPTTGHKLEGTDRNRVIQLFRGFPPVAGLDPSHPNYFVAVQDKKDAKEGYVNPSNGKVEFIPPVGLDLTSPQGAANFKPYVPPSPSSQATGATENTGLVSLPPWLSALQVVSTSKYVAQVSIFDHFGNVLRSFTQSFGYQGEMGNVKRVVPKGLVSYLVWDQKDKKGQLAGQGVYVWKVVFTFETGKQEIQYTRTGIMRLAGN